MDPNKTFENYHWAWHVIDENSLIHIVDKERPSVCSRIQSTGCQETHWPPPSPMYITVNLFAANSILWIPRIIVVFYWRNYENRFSFTADILKSEGGMCACCLGIQLEVTNMLATDKVLDRFVCKYNLRTKSRTVGSHFKIICSWRSILQNENRNTSLKILF